MDGEQGNRYCRGPYDAPTEMNVMAGEGEPVEPHASFLEIKLK